MDFFKSEKQRITFHDASLAFVLLFVIVVMAFEESTAGIPHAGRIHNDILPIIALTLGAIVTILLIKAKNEIYYLQNSLQVLASWQKNPLKRIEEFSPALYGEERDIARSVVLYAMVHKDEPDPSNVKAMQSYYRHITVAKLNIRRTAAEALDLEGEWRDMYLDMRKLEKKFYENLPCPAETADSKNLYQLRALLLYLYGLHGKELFDEALFDKGEVHIYTEAVQEFPELNDEQKKAVAHFYTNLVEIMDKEESEIEPDHTSEILGILCPESDKSETVNKNQSS